MAFTPKQQRQGTDIGGADHNTAAAGPYPDVGSVMSQATAAGNAYNNSGHAVMTGAGLPDQAPREWDQGLAINDIEGGGSG
jgi:hypothetical protein